MENSLLPYEWKRISRTNNTNTYGLKSKHAAPPVSDLKPFEDDVAKMIESVKFCNTSDNFIKTLERDKRKISASNNVFVPADKTRNFYEMSAPAYNKLLTENVTKTYKHAPDDTMQKINEELKYIASELNITNRIDPMNETPAFISLKDHKADFENNPKCRLINPAKSSLGKVSKSILDNINKIIRQKTQASQWRNSTDVISWFKSIPCKERNPSYPLTSQISTPRSPNSYSTDLSHGQGNSRISLRKTST